VVGDGRCARRAVGAGAEALRAALAVVAPVRCAGCGREDEALCPSCARALRPDPRIRPLPGLAVAAAAEYAGTVRAVLLAMKAGDRPALCRPLAAMLGPALDLLAREVTGPGEVDLVPVPSTAAAVRERGFRHVDRLIAALPRPGRPHRALRLSGDNVDQAGLGRAARFAQRRAAFVCRPSPGRRFVLVDDIVTSGATLLAAADAARAAGADVVGAAVVASTRRQENL